MRERCIGVEQERGIKGIFKVKLAAKPLVIAWTVMKKKEIFAYEQLLTNGCTGIYSGGGTRTTLNYEPRVG
ncbi:hypothetical protein [Prosthecochloris sp.]|uniref:hypothetical protein n=1 Tax=Prosthecochloris sp. TaxID=290513 RepID=UPI00257C4131|nr:hypothetical protein [Prosthecochloris sp.]